MEHAFQIHKGTYYFQSERLAEQWGERNDYPTHRIRRFGRGWALQYGVSGSYAPEHQAFRGMR